MVYHQHAGAFFLSCKFKRTLPVTLSSVYGVMSTAGPRRPSRVGNGFTRRFRGGADRTARMS
jgi:hypothetical protein